MRQQHAADSEMAEKCHRLITFFLHTIMRPFSYISVLCEKAIKFFNHMIVYFYEIGIFRHFCFSPCIFIHISFMFCPIPRNHIPCNSRLEIPSFFFHIRICFFKFRLFIQINLRRELLQPIQYFCCFSSYLKTWSRRILRSSKWRLIAFPHIHRYCTFCKQCRFTSSFFC